MANEEHRPLGRFAAGVLLLSAAAVVLAFRLSPPDPVITVLVLAPLLLAAVILSHVAVYRLGL